MTHLKLGVGKWSTVCAGFLSVAALVSVTSVAPASADETDDAFIAALASRGITMPDPDTAIAMARTVCAGLDTNQTVPILAMQLMRDNNLSPRDSGFFIGLSVAAYCPQYKGTTDSSDASLLP